MKLNRLPYHLRLNKTADRFTFIEAIGRLNRFSNLEDYMYYGLGGPFLEDFRLIYEFYPQVKMVSIEHDENIYKCQEFHRPCVDSHLSLEFTDLTSFITSYDPQDNLSIFWLDYTDLALRCFKDFKALLEKISLNSMIKVTLRADTREYWASENKSRERKAQSFQKKFREVMPDPSEDPPRGSVDFAYLLQRMVQLAAQQALPPEATPITFQPVSSFYYSDGTTMFTITGIVCLKDNIPEVIETYQGWEFANTDWSLPKLIDVPILSTKERLNLQECLPCSSSAGSVLSSRLGYLISDNTEAALQQYAIFHRYSPYFLRGTP